MSINSSTPKPRWDFGQALMVVGQKVGEIDKKAALKNGLCFAAELVLVALQFNLVYEAIEGAQLEMKYRFSDLPLIGWVFTFTPELTGMHLLALLTAACFVLTPVILWYHYLDGFSFRGASPAERAGGCLFLVIFFVAIIVDVWVVRQRMAIGASNPFMVQTGQEPALVAAMGVILALVNVAAAFMTAYVYHTTRKQEASHA